MVALMAALRTSRPGRRPPFVVLALVVAGILAACTEDFQGGAACPALCPEQNVVVFDTTFDPVELDTTVTGFPTHGTETELLLARRGDTVDTRPVIRFDSLPIYFNSGSPTADTVIQVIDSPYVKLRINRASSVFTQPVTFEVFDVDTTSGDSAFAANDTSTALERLLFRPDRRIGMITFDTAQITDSVRIPIDSLALLNKILNQQRLRLGFRATSTGPVQIRIVPMRGRPAAAAIPAQRRHGICPAHRVSPFRGAPLPGDAGGGPDRLRARLQFSRGPRRLAPDRRRRSRTADAHPIQYSLADPRLLQRAPRDAGADPATGGERR
jgi:hypothetical protein